MMNIEYRDKSISGLVEELHELGQNSVQILPTTLSAIIFNSNPLKRFKNIEKNHMPSTFQEYFLIQDSQKKYYYHQVHQNILQIVHQINHNFQSGYHCNVITQTSYKNTVDILHQLGIFGQCIGSLTQYALNSVNDLLQNIKLRNNEKTKYFQTSIENIIDHIPRQMGDQIYILKILRKEIGSQLRLILLPKKVLQNGSSNDGFNLVRRQIYQILNFIKTNPNKRYSQLNQILTKRHYITNVVLQMILDQASNYVINYTNNSNIDTFDFFDKMVGINNFAKRNKPNLDQYPKIDNKKTQNTKQNNKEKKNKVSEQKINEKSKQKTVKMMIDNSTKQIEYCRDFQRKTHRYSILDEDQNEKIQTGKIKLEQQTNEAQQILILKAQHALEISKYHQTIQTLNSKILAITKSQGIEELMQIHEKQIIMLQFKIKQLRKDIQTLVSHSNVSESQKLNDLKKIISKLNLEIQSNQQKITSQKIGQGKVKLIEKQLNIWRQKYEESQKNRIKLGQQIKKLTSRLINNNKAKQELEQLPSKDKRIVEEIMNLMNESHLAKYVLDEINAKLVQVVKEISQYRETVLQCNDFLVELQSHLQSKLGSKDPEVVLDCNRFIRGFLLSNLDIV